MAEQPFKEPRGAGQVKYSDEAVKLANPLNAKIMSATGFFLVSQNIFQSLDIKPSPDWRASNRTASGEIRTSDQIGRITGKGVLVPPGSLPPQRPFPEYSGTQSRDIRARQNSFSARSGEKKFNYFSDRYKCLFRSISFHFVPFRIVSCMC